MYQSFFGLEKFPFAMAPDPGCVFLTAYHREAIAGLLYAITHRKGLLVLTGEVGTGKTTVLSRVLRFLPANVQSSMILHPTLSTDDFLEMAMLDFGIKDIPTSKARRLAKLHEFLIDAHHTGKTPALIVDEAHKLSHELLEEIRLLGNFDLADQKLLQIVLAGQSELDGLLRSDDLRQLKQRVATRVSLRPLDNADIPAYVKYRWAKAGGGTTPPFSASALEAVARWSRGIPRLINSICDNALLLAFAGHHTTVELSHVLEAAADLDLRPPEPNSVPGAAAAGAPAPNPVPVTTTIPQIRVPEFRGVAASKPSLLNRFATKLGLA